MRSAFDFSPLFRSTVGFDRLAQLLEASARTDEASLTYPPYNIEKFDDDAYRITMAVAGFSIDDLFIESRDNTLLVSGKPPVDDSRHVYLHQGIAGRAFQRTFQLNDHVKVVGATLENGLLHVDLEREVPEEKKPRNIEISSGSPQTIAGKSKKISETKKVA